MLFVSVSLRGLKYEMVSVTSFHIIPGSESLLQCVYIYSHRANQIPPGFLPGTDFVPRRSPARLVSIESHL